MSEQTVIKLAVMTPSQRDESKKDVLKVYAAAASAIDHCHELEEFFRTPPAREDESLLSEAVEKVLGSIAQGDARRLESEVTQVKYSLEDFFAAIRFAAGLRAAGTPTSAARQMMLGLLCEKMVSD